MDLFTLHIDKPRRRGPKRCDECVSVHGPLGGLDQTSRRGRFLGLGWSGIRLGVLRVGDLGEARAEQEAENWGDGGGRHGASWACGVEKLGTAYSL